MSFEGVIGSSTNFRAVLEDVAKVAPACCTVLVRGETGTGKEEIAKAIHESSARRRYQFVAVNCAAIPSALLESELFGCERGAFTGAVAPRIGRFQAADRGTLFLDEISELPLELQPKLLRALQTHGFERLGSTQTTHVDVRVIAATNQDLLGMVRERRFRPDLYYRLNVFPITLPPLRERIVDIPALVAHFVRTFARQHGKTIEQVPEDVIQALEAYPWPGNIRELQNFIERSVILSSGPALRAPVHELRDSGLSQPVVRTLADADRAHIMTTLRQTNGVVGGPNGAAARLGLKRTTLIARMQKLGLLRKEPSQAPQAGWDTGRAPSPCLI